MSASNYPPGVTGNEPQITGEWPCKNCGATLPEEQTCSRCDGTGREPYRYDGEPDGGATCTECRGARTVAFEGDTCPDGCGPDEDAAYDRMRDERAEGRDDDDPGR